MGTSDDVVLQEFPICDKCGNPVVLEDDVVAFDWIQFRKQRPFMKDLPLAVYRIVSSFPVGLSRHLLPRTDCEGSPSRSQYLEGQPIDERWDGKFTYKPALESFYKRSFDELQVCAAVEK